MNIFADMGLDDRILLALEELGYETPTPVQKKSIPFFLEGDDVVAHAQTGTGKTAAFALPILSNVDPRLKVTQAIVLAPTRELAMQVAEAFKSYAKQMPGVCVAAIYGGQSYTVQRSVLNKGAHVIVGTPGRVMDHMRQRTIRLDKIKTVVLDEADEMLNMGFVDDIEWILEHVKHRYQMGLFSATMPARIKSIIKNYTHNPQHVSIKTTVASTNAITQTFMCVQENQKLEALTRYLEVADNDAAIIFARTRQDTNELAETLRAKGYNAAALNGDMNQGQRQQTIAQLKQGKIDLLIATDVAARGIDVARITHVINFNLPYDNETYVHRIGRTGRAGRKGTALLFVTPRQRRAVSNLAYEMKATIDEITPPTVKEIKSKRAHVMQEKIMSAMEKTKRLMPYSEWVSELIEKTGVQAQEIATAMAYLMNAADPLPAYDIECPPPGHSSKPGKKSNNKGKRKAKHNQDSYKRRKSNQGRDQKKPSFNKRKPKKK